LVARVKAGLDMDEDTRRAQKSSLQELQSAVVRQLVAGADQRSVIQQLIERGWPEVSARKFVSNLAQTSASTTGRIEMSHSEHAAHHGRWRALRGLILILVGMVIMGAGLALRDPSFSLFTFAVGVILAVFGLLDLLFGISVWTAGDD
jgi:hypothetical protein